ncbi:MAG: GNAT family N-acetyltransferase [Mycobacteriales bacterium]
MDRQSDLVVRAATPADADTLGEIHVRTWQVGYAGILPAEHLAAMSVERRREGCRTLLTDPAGPRERPDRPPPDNYVAERAGRIVGFTTVGPSRDPDAGEASGEVYSIYVAPAAWGTGAGRALMAQGLDRLRERGYAAATLWVLEGNMRASRFYERAGFAPDGCRAPYSREGWTRDELRYRRDL